ncbi:12541_t:CDS:2 [Ambispora gerdemannii]|uniref:Eukaryotic translation initiation factor 3 subunit A n=1 Tax=Ambispora gerdemannii TaxID=144530 RepID=A0A9N8VJZ6_9GLOM|nr:12541_t:CDS:2 [Ambispora gerdemannii]
MAPLYQRPENALKRAEELIAVGQNAAALQSLHEIVISKRSRTQPLAALEPIMLRFVELCVNLRKGKIVKEGLHQYKNISQNTSVTTIELVIRKFIELSEGKVTEAQAKADQITLDALAIDDLEASETPESIMLSTVSGEQSKDRTDRAVVTPWLKFLWEAYRTVLDILRNNARLEIFYQSTANQAFQFCLKYTRKTEFRRLCDLLRNHLQNIAKYAHQPHSINLNEPETLQRHLDTRFAQLNAAVELELWQEAFRSIEDIHNLLSMSKRPPKPYMMANYYDKLTKIFLVSENYLFHAAAWNRYYTLVKAQNKALSDEDNTRYASFVLLSALSIPVITSNKTRAMIEIDDNKSKQHRLAALLGMNRSPTRTGLLKEALNKNILRRVRPELRDLYNILEVQFHPLSICKKIEPIMTQLAQDTEMAKYVKPLHQVILTRLFQQLSQVYDSVKLEFVIKLASFAPPYNYDAATIEKFIMNGCKKGELAIRIDHVTNSLTFETDLFSASKDADADGAKLQASPADRMRDQLSRLAKCFYTTVHLIDPSIIEAKKETRRQALERAFVGIEEEHNKALARKAIIERRKELAETLLMRKEKEEQRERALRQKQRAEEEAQRRIEEAKKRELERRKREHEAIQREEAKKLAESLKSKNLKVQPEDLENLDTDRLVQLQVEQLEKEKKELNERLRATAKRMDHLERAYRKEEIPLLEKDYERQRKADRAYHEAAQQERLEAEQRLCLNAFLTFKNFRKLDEIAAKQKARELQAEEKRLQREREREKEERVAKERATKEREERELKEKNERDDWRRREEKPPATQTATAVRYVPPASRTSTEAADPWRRPPAPKTGETWRKSELPPRTPDRPIRTTDEKGVPERRKTDERPWRKSSVRSTEESESLAKNASGTRRVARTSNAADESDTWRRTPSQRDESKSEWRQGGDRQDRIRDNSRDEDETETSSRGPPRILKTNTESGWRSRSMASKQQELEKSPSEGRSGALSRWRTSEPDEMQDDEKGSGDEDKSAPSPASKSQLQTPASTAEDDDGFIPVVKGKRKGRTSSTPLYDNE